MALRGYKKKTRPALWTQLPSVMDAAATEAALRESLRMVKRGMDRVEAAVRSNRRAAERLRVTLAAAGSGKPERKPRKRIRPVSVRRQKVTAEYRKAARAFVAAAVARGETCPVVARICELRDGMKYGHPISCKLNEVHHARGRVGNLLLDQRFWMAVSKQGHRWIHEHPAEARERGWLAGLGYWNTPPKD